MGVIKDTLLAVMLWFDHFLDSGAEICQIEVFGWTSMEMIFFLWKQWIKEVTKRYKVWKI